MLSIFERIAVQRIQEAMRNGEFDNNPYHGKPLPKDDLDRVPEDLRFAYKLMKNANLIPKELGMKKKPNQKISQRGINLPGMILILLFFIPISPLHSEDKDTRPRLETNFGHRSAMDGAVFANDGRYFLTWSTFSSEVKLWSNQGKILKSYTTRLPGAAHFSNDGRNFAFGDYSGFWKFCTILTQVCNDVKANGSVHAISIHPKEDKVALWYWYQDKIEFQTSQGKVLGTMPIGIRNTFEKLIVFSPDGKLLAIPNKKKVDIYDINSNKLLRSMGGVFSGHGADVSAMSFAADSPLFASGDRGGRVCVWDNQGSEIGKINTPVGAIKSIYFMPGGNNIAISGNQGAVVANIKGNIIQTVSQNILGSYQDNFAGKGEKKDTILIVNINSLFSLTAGKEPEKKMDFAKLYSFHNAVFSADGSRFGLFSGAVSESSPGTIGALVYAKARPGFVKENFTYQASSLYSNGVSRDVVHPKGELKITQVKLPSGSSEKRLIYKGQAQGEITGFIWAMAFHPTENFLAGGDADGRLFIYNEKGVVVNRKNIFTDDISGAAFSADGRILALTGVQGITTLVDFPGLNPLANIYFFSDKDYVVAAPDGRYDFGGSGENQLHWVTGAETVALAEFRGIYHIPDLLSEILGYRPASGIAGKPPTKSEADKPKKENIMNQLIGKVWTVSSGKVEISTSMTGGLFPGQTLIVLAGSEYVPVTVRMVFHTKVVAAYSSKTRLVKGQPVFRGQKK